LLPVDRIGNDTYRDHPGSIEMVQRISTPAVAREELPEVS
jgi:hypothetical protein